MLSLDDVKKKFVDQVKIRAYDDKYIDRTEEKEILQVALQDGVSVDAARGALVQVCEAQGYVLESVAVKQMKQTLEVFAKSDGAVDEKEFTDCVNILLKATEGKINEVKAKRMVLEVMEDNAYKARTGWFSNWHKAARKSVGM